MTESGRGTADGADVAPRADGERAPESAPAPTLIPISRRVFIALLVAGVLVLLWLLNLAPSVVVVALGGAALALALSFPVRMLARRMPRWLAILLTFLTLAGVVVLAIVVLVPPLLGQIIDLIGALPTFTARAENAARSVLSYLEAQGLLPESPQELLTDIRQQLLGRVEGVARGLLGGVVGALSGAFDLGIKLFGILFVAAYLLIDVRKVRGVYRALAPERYRDDADQLWESVNHSLSRYLSGLALSLAIQGVLSAVALWLIGVPYALLLGVWVAFTALIPNLGVYIGAIPAVVLAFFVSPTTALLTVLLYTAIQQLEGNLLTPRIQGDAVRVHPVIILLAVIGAAEAAGLLGAVFAVPVLAVVRVLWDFLRERVVVRA